MWRLYGCCCCREVLETLYRLSLTGFLVLINQGSSSQVIIGSLFAIAYVKLHEVYRPYEDSRLNVAKGMSLWQIYFIFFLALISYAELVNRDDITFNVVVVCVMFINFPLEMLIAYVLPHFRVNTINNSSVTAIKKCRSVKGLELF
jgi:hypothetical protein